MAASNKQPYCCVKLFKAIQEGRVRHDGKQWHTISSSVYMLIGMMHCMYCGKKLPTGPIVSDKKLPLIDK